MSDQGTTHGRISWSSRYSTEQLFLLNGVGFIHAILGESSNSHKFLSRHAVYPLEARRPNPEGGSDSKPHAATFIQRIIHSDKQTPSPCLQT